MHIEYKERRTEESSFPTQTQEEEEEEEKNNENDKTKQTNKQAHDIFVFFSHISLIYKI